MFFINGGKVWTEDLKSHVTGSSEKELKNFKGLHSVDGYHMDVFCELLDESFYTDRIIDVFQDVLLTFHRAEDMKNYLSLRIDEQKISTAKKMSEYDFEYDTPF